MTVPDPPASVELDPPGILSSTDRRHHVHQPWWERGCGVDRFDRNQSPELTSHQQLGQTRRTASLVSQVDMFRPRA